MSTRRRPETTARYALWAGGPVLILARLIGMHGHASHSASAIDTTPQIVMTATSMVTEHAVPVSHQVGSAVATAWATTGDNAMDMGMAGLCLAVLAIAVAALLRLTGRVCPL